MWCHDWLSIIFNILSIRSISKHATTRSHRRPNEKTLYLSLPPQWQGISSRCKAKYKVHKSSHWAYGETGRDRDEINFKLKKKTFIELFFKKTLGPDWLHTISVPLDFSWFLSCSFRAFLNFWKLDGSFLAPQVDGSYNFCWAQTPSHIIPFFVFPVSCVSVI